MMNNKFFPILVLVGILALKISSAAVHMQLHHGEADDHQNQCELCEFALQNQDLDSEVLEFSVELPTTFVAYPDLVATYNNPTSTTVRTFTLFGRPPPSI